MDPTLPLPPLLMQLERGFRVMLSCGLNLYHRCSFDLFFFPTSKYNYVPPSSRMQRQQPKHDRSLLLGFLL